MGVGLGGRSVRAIGITVAAALTALFGITAESIITGDAESKSLEVGLALMSTIGGGILGGAIAYWSIRAGAKAAYEQERKLRQEDHRVRAIEATLTALRSLQVAMADIPNADVLLPDENFMNPGGGEIVTLDVSHQRRGESIDQINDALTSVQHLVETYPRYLPRVLTDEWFRIRLHVGLLRSFLAGIGRDRSRELNRIAVGEVMYTRRRLGRVVRHLVELLNAELHTPGAEIDRIFPEDQLRRLEDRNPDVFDLFSEDDDEPADVTT